MSRITRHARGNTYTMAAAPTKSHIEELLERPEQEQSGLSTIPTRYCASSLLSCYIIIYYRLYTSGIKKKKVTVLLITNSINCRN